ncbi:FAD-dependent monooxygenase [Polaribacter sp. OB-PA-B3]
MIKTDVCIIGAGPSGASTSLTLSKMKIPHYIIDKSTFPRDKTCGDGLILYAYKALRLLDEGLFSKFLNHPKFIHSKNIKLHINSKLSINFKESEDRNMVITYAKRYDFDYFLVNNLSKKYASLDFGNGVKNISELKDGVLIKLKDGKEILSKIVIGADGVNSIVARKLAGNKIQKNLTSTFVNGYFKNVINLPKTNEAEIRIIYKKIPLFFYIFPLADGSVNISLGGNAKLILKHNINLVEEVETIIRSHPKVAYKFINAIKIDSWRGWSIPYNFGKNKVYGNRFMLVGDAAGLTNPFYKEGVGTGMMSGIICAQSIEASLKNNNFSAIFLATYAKNLNNEFGRLLKFSRLMLKATQFKFLFGAITYLLKNKIELKATKVIKRKSY